MKHSLTLLLALALCLVLAACHQYLPEGEPAAPSEPVDDPIDPGVPADEPLELDALNVEFLAGDRDINELMALQRAFPKALADALGLRLVEVDAVNITFGTSAEATAEALRSGAVDIAFLPVETVLEQQLEAVALEQYDAPDLALTAVVQADGLPVELTQPLLDALPDLTAALAHYTGEEQGGSFVPCTEAFLANLTRLYETGEAVLHTESVVLGDLALTLDGIGSKVNDYAWGIRAIEVRDGDTPLQTIEMTEAADDPDGGLDEYTSCPEPGWLFRTVDANFDGYDDIEVFGWVPNNTIPYFYWLWNPETQQYEYRFRLQGPTIDPSSRTLTAEYRESAAVYWRDTYEWQGGDLALVSHEQVTE